MTAPVSFLQPTKGARLENPAPARDGSFATGSREKIAQSTACLWPVSPSWLKFQVGSR
jgi:hypothetical protein